MPRLLVLAVALLTIVLHACGGDESVFEIPPPEPTTADTMLRPLLTGTGELKLFDPSSPGTAAVTVDTGITVPTVGSPYSSSGVLRVLAAGAYDGSGNDVSEAHFRYIAYVKGGQVFRVSLLQGSPTTPVLVSAITTACSLVAVVPDLADALDSGVLVEVQGGDGTCAAPNDTVYVQLDALTGDAGVTLPSQTFIRGTIRAADGSIAGHLVQEGPTTARFLKRYDASFGAAVTLTALVNGTTVDASVMASREQHHLALQPMGQATYRIYRYSSADNSLTALHTYTTVPDTLRETSAGDATHLYFADGNKLHRVAHGQTVPQLLHTAAANVEFLTLKLTTNRIVATAADSNTGNVGVFSLPKAGAANLTTFAGFTSEPVELFTTAGTLTYVAIGSTGSVDVFIFLEGGGGNSVSDAVWAGTLQSAAFDVGGLSAQAGPIAVLFGEVEAGGIVTFGMVDAPSGATARVFGTIANALRAGSFDFGRYVLASIEIDRGATEDFDVYFADGATGDSLRGVATVSGQDDIPVF